MFKFSFMVVCVLFQICYGKNNSENYKYKNVNYEKLQQSLKIVRENLLQEKANYNTRTFTNKEQQYDDELCLVQFNEITNGITNFEFWALESEWLNMLLFINLTVLFGQNSLNHKKNMSITTKG